MNAPLSKITAPYNFVPLARTILCPDWAKHISHDLPFRDGISGYIEVELTAHTDIFVGGRGNGGVRRFHTGSDGKPAIPGSSLRGMFRNVMEIMSFGRMNRIDDRQFGIRDLSPTAKDSMAKTKDVKTGWLSFEQGVYKISPCNYVKATHEAIARLIPAYTRNNSVRGKYRSIAPEFNVTKDLPTVLVGNSPRSGTVVDGLGHGMTEGIFVFTGNMETKLTEHIFLAPDASKKYEVEPRIFSKFLKIYTDQEKSDDTHWEFWKPRLMEGKKVPVFFTLSKKLEVHAIGLSWLIKLPCENSVADAIRNVNPAHVDIGAPDFTDCLFGFANDTQSLKGRVSFSEARLQGTAQFGNEVRLVLNGPKASFYPSYIDQGIAPEVIKHNTYESRLAQVRGWKRYPLHRSVSTTDTGGVNENLISKFVPLRRDTRFRFRVHVHNLRPAELGGLLWSITWGEPTGHRCLRHAVGGAKSYGYGQVTAKIVGSKLRHNDTQIGEVDINHSMALFEKMMNAFITRVSTADSWRETPQMVELEAMSSIEQLKPADDLKHMKLKEFMLSKNKVGVNGKKGLVLKSHAGTRPVTWRPSGVQLEQHP